MQLSLRQVQIVEALYSLNIELARGDEGQRRQLTQMIDEQIAFEFGARWGMKARAGGNISNASKDSIAYLEDDGTVSTWDWQNGTTREPQIHVGMEPSYSHLPLSEAKFISVQPINHLAGEVPDDDSDEDDNDEEAALAAILKSIANNTDAIIANQAKLLENQTLMMQTLKFILNGQTRPPVFPEYEGTISWSGKVTLKPKK